MIEQNLGPQIPEPENKYERIAVENFSNLYPGYSFYQLPEFEYGRPEPILLAKDFVGAFLLDRQIKNACQSGELILERQVPSRTDRNFYYLHLVENEFPSPTVDIDMELPLRLLKDSEQICGAINVLFGDNKKQYKVVKIGIIEDGEPNGFVWYRDGIETENKSFKRTPTLKLSYEF